MTKWVYSFEEGSADMRNLLGGKGANLAEMTNLGLPIPQGFTVTTEACTDYYNQGKAISEVVQEQIFAALADLEKSRTNCSVIPGTRCWFPSVPVPGLPCPA